MASLLCLENPLLDITVFGDKALLDKYGLKANDAILADEKQVPIYEELLANKSVLLTAGGGAQNTARGAQYILKPSSVLYIGCVGRDKYADILTEANAKAGVQTEYRVDDEQATGRCGVVITDHNRSLCTDLAAANCYRLDHLKQPRIWSMVEAAQIYFVGGYHLTVCPDAALALATHAAENNKVFMMSLSAPFIPTVFKDPLDKTAPYWDYVVGNETEAVAWAEAHGLSTKSIPEIAVAMAKLPKANSKRPRTVIITQGADPSVVAVSGETEIKTFPIRKISGSDIKDTTGAGDAFAGGFLAGLVEGKPLETAIDMGHWLANLSIRELGASYPESKATYQPSA